MKTNLIFLVYGVFGIVYGVRIDGWWHYAFGRNEFWITPHMIIALSVGSCMFFGWRSFQLSSGMEKRERSALKLFCMLIFGIFAIGVVWDQVWHTFIGLETLDSIWLTLGPAHVLQKVFFLLATGTVFPVVKKYAGNFYSLLLLVSGYIMAWESLALPFKSFGGMRVLGSYGEFFLAFILIGAFILAKRLLDKNFSEGGSLIIAGISLALIYVGISSRVAPGLRITPLPPVPNWLVGLSFFTCAASIDFYWERLKQNPLVLGSIAGVCYGCILAPLAKIFLQYFDVHFSWTYVAEVILSSMLGGGLAATLANQCTEERLWKLSEATFVRKIVLISTCFIFATSALFFILQASGIISYGI